MAQPPTGPGTARPRAPDAADLRRQAASVPQWDVDEERLARTWRFRDFAHALAFVQQVGEAAERLGHHPDIHLTGAREVRLECATHSAGGVTAKDFTLAAAIDALPAAKAPPAGQRSSTPSP